MCIYVFSFSHYALSMLYATKEFLHYLHYYWSLFFRSSRAKTRLLLEYRKFKFEHIRRSGLTGITAKLNRKLLALVGVFFLLPGTFFPTLWA